MLVACGERPFRSSGKNIPLRSIPYSLPQQSFVPAIGSAVLIKAQELQITEEMLLDLCHCAKLGGMRNDSSLSRLIPVTALRHFYRTLRRFESQAFHLQAAEECRRRPEQLAELVMESRRHFTLYDNRDEGFHNRDNQGGLTDARLASGQLANTLVQQVAENGVKISSASPYEFDFVDYEISPIRTTRSAFEDGSPGLRGRGGVDLLLSNRHDHTPIVGEVKADTDRNPFLGLIQSLSYAVELSTEPQRSRLDQHYPGRFEWTATGPWIDIYLLLLRYPKDDTSRRFLDLTDHISEKILSRNSPVAGVIRRIIGLHASMDTDSAIDFTVAFSHGSSEEDG